MRNSRRTDLWIIAIILVLDQATKALVRARFNLYDELELIPGFLNLTRGHNTGAAFGFLNAADFPYKTTVIAAIATAALVGVGLYSASRSPHQVVARVGLALIVGGAAGNLIDRVVLGSVVDFVDVYWRDYHFWAFKVADSAITAGVILMIADMLRSSTDVPATV